MATRYRCGACGNRTRFDVLSTKRSRAFHHFDLGGGCTVEDEEVLSLVVESVTCRWCGSAAAVEALDGDGDRAPDDRSEAPASAPVAR